MKTKLFIAAIFFFQTFYLIGQIQLEMEKINMDSLQEALPVLDRYEKVDALNKLSMILCVDDPDSSISMANRSIALSKKLDYNKGMADGFFNKGNAFFIIDSLKPSVINYIVVRPPGGRGY